MSARCWCSGGGGRGGAVPFALSAAADSSFDPQAPIFPVAHPRDRLAPAQRTYTWAVLHDRAAGRVAIATPRVHTITIVRCSLSMHVPVNPKPATVY